jgi:hypothetical protein
VKRFSADDSAGSRVKVGHRQTSQPETPSPTTGRFFSPMVNGGLEVDPIIKIDLTVVDASCQTVASRRVFITPCRRLVWAKSSRST